MNQAWFAETYPADKFFHTKLLADADAAVYGDLPWQPVVLQELLAATAEKPARARLLPSGRTARPLTVRLKKYPWLSQQPLGAPLQARCEPVNGIQQVVQLVPRPEGKPWDTRPAPRPQPVAVVTREFNGLLRIQAAGFGFADNVFIPAQLIGKNGWQTGQRLKGTAVSQFDQKKGKDGWVAERAEAIAASNERPPES
ncbi:hypothetical protein [Hymenobacter terrenus]|uniref:hypothetical protein n=1 Tax=Hymenobacter terrenus TaxID=1629124 RepID=UPI0006192A9E|nr:hypothetical protein [Hymenobacter terrenus]